MKHRFAMRRRLALLPLIALCLTLAAVPAAADNLYDNGPINGNGDAWVFNFGFTVSDSFVLGFPSTISGLAFGAHLFPGDVLTSVEVSITSEEFGGTTYFDQTVNFTQTDCTTNGFGFNVCTETGSFSPVNLNAGTYWLNMQNASVPSGDPVFWDENSGPSYASETSVGTIPSEAFTILGTSNSTSTGKGGLPEPSSILLFGSGALGLAGFLRRKLF